jgi:hypothetical protein
MDAGISQVEIVDPGAFVEAEFTAGRVADVVSTLPAVITGLRGGSISRR